MVKILITLRPSTIEILSTCKTIKSIEGCFVHSTAVKNSVACLDSLKSWQASWRFVIVQSSDVLLFDLLSPILRTGGRIDIDRSRGLCGKLDTIIPSTWIEAVLESYASGPSPLSSQHQLRFMTILKKRSGRLGPQKAYPGLRSKPYAARPLLPSSSSNHSSIDKHIQLPQILWPERIPTARFTFKTHLIRILCVTRTSVIR